MRARALTCPLAFALAVCGTAHAQASPVEIVGVDADLRAGLVAVLPERDAPRSLFDAEREAEEAAAIARAFLRSEGYYAAEIEAEAQDDPPVARVRITPGPRYRYAQAALVYDDAAPDAGAASTLDARIAALSPGAAARAGDVLGAEQAMVEILRARGYPDATIKERRVIVDHAAQTLQATFHIRVGAAARLGAVRVAPEGVVRQEVADRFAGWDPGVPYAPDRLSRLRRAAASTGAFASVDAALADAPNAQGLRDVTLRLEPRAPRSIELGAGYSTTDGAGAEAEWSLRNRLRRAETITVAVQAAELKQAIDARLALPFSDDAGRTITWSAGAAHEDAGPYNQDSVYLGWSRDARPRQRIALSYGLRASADAYSEAAGIENAIVFSAFGAARRDTTANTLDARQGDVIDVRLEPSIATGDQTTGFVRALADARTFESFRDDESFTLALRARAGWIAPLVGDDADLPLDRLFYAGGGGSVRGYAYNSIAPETFARSAEPPGGRGLLETSVEARARFSGAWGGVVFLDGGTAVNDLEDAADFRWGAGIGVRYDLGFAPLRLDLAAPIDPRPGDEDFAVYVSIGQAF